jgi:Zn-dependent protease with chaperone function
MTSALPTLQGAAWSLFHKVRRAAQVGALAVVLYQTGHSRGVIEAVQRPEATRQSMLEQVLAENDGAAGNGAAIAAAGDDEDDTQGASARTKRERAAAAARARCLPESSSEHKRVAKVGLLLLKSAAEHASLKHAEASAARERARRAARHSGGGGGSGGGSSAAASAAAAKAVAAAVPHDLDPPNASDDERALRAALLGGTGGAAPDLQAQETLWENAAAMLRAPHEWRFVVARSMTPNAFVTPLCPKHVFVNAGLLQALGGNDELAVVLGHELAHAVLAHGEGSSDLAGDIALASLVALTAIDPVGILPTVFDAGVWLGARLFLKSYSREHEEQADFLGMQIAARASFNTRRGARCLKSLEGAVQPRSVEDGAQRQRARTGWDDVSERRRGAR